VIRYGGCISGPEEEQAVLNVLRSGNWASGEVTREFEQKAARVQERSHALFVNSGSSGLLLSLSLLERGTKVAMPALQFPTLYTAALNLGLEPWLVDIDDSLNMDPAQLDFIAGDVDAVAFVHMAGNSTNADTVREICVQNGLWFIEDICEAFGSEGYGTKAGNFGDVSATSTHGAHHISTGEGGLVFTDMTFAYQKMKRFRDWGRSLGSQKIDDFPTYYDGYTFAERGYNLHATDIQAALGIVQLDKLEDFTFARRANHRALSAYTTALPIRLPDVSPDVNPSWYTFPFLVPRHRDEAIAYLLDRGIEARPIVCGNLVRQPVYKGYQGEVPEDYPCADKWFKRGMWVSCHPRLTFDDLDHIATTIRDFTGA
jgi:CDP-4-dehydro-6-deoxyglucose reductase, E1